MGLIRLANETGKNLPVGTDGDFVIVREEISKRTRNRLILQVPQRDDIEETGLTIGEGLDFQPALFAELVIGWSAELDCNMDNYLALAPEAADAIDEVLAEYFSEMMPTKEEQGKQ